MLNVFWNDEVFVNQTIFLKEYQRRKIKYTHDYLRELFNQFQKNLSRNKQYEEQRVYKSINDALNNFI